METTLNIKVHKNENIYLVLKMTISAILYFLIFNYLIGLYSDFDKTKVPQLFLIVYIVLIILYVFFRFGVIIGYVKGNAIRVSEKQFPDIHTIVKNQSEMLGLKKAPTVYILQSGGILNAFAARFMGKNYVVLFSEIVESAYEQDTNILAFIIGHELGHIKRNHMFKNMLLFPSLIIPFLTSAYSRACEYTCDNIGFNLAPKGLKSGLLILASGRSIYKKVNVDEYIQQGNENEGFWKWFAEKISTHPNLNKRIAVYENEPVIVKPTEIKVEPKSFDHTRYMPE